MLALSLQQSFTPQASFHYDSDDESADDFEPDDEQQQQQHKLPVMRRPELQRRCANQRTKTGCNGNTGISPSYHKDNYNDDTVISVLTVHGHQPPVALPAKPDLNVPRQYSRYPYLNYATVVAHGYMNKVEDDLQYEIPDEINKLVLRYAINKEDGLFQLAHYLCSMLSKLSQPFISMKLVHALIAHFFNKSGNSTQKEKASQITEYYGKLENMQYIVAVKLAKDISYFGVFNGSTMNYYAVSKK